MKSGACVDLPTVTMDITNNHHHLLPPLEVSPVFNFPGEHPWRSPLYPQPLQFLLVSHDLWVVTERARRRLQSAEMSFLHQVAGLGDGEELSPPGGAQRRAQDRLEGVGPSAGLGTPVTPPENLKEVSPSAGLGTPGIPSKSWRSLRLFWFHPQATSGEVQPDLGGQAQSAHGQTTCAFIRTSKVQHSSPEESSWELQLDVSLPVWGHPTKTDLLP